MERARSAGLVFYSDDRECGCQFTEPPPPTAPPPPKRKKNTWITGVTAGIQPK